MLPRRGPRRRARARASRTLDERFSAEASDPGASDVKSRLQEWSEATGLGAPALRGASARGRATSSASPRPSRSAASSPAPARAPRRRPQSSTPHARHGSDAMPELPEVETVRSVLSRELTGKKIKAVTVTNGKLTQAAQVGEGVPRPARGHDGQVGRPARQEPRHRARLGQPPRHPPRHVAASCCAPRARRTSSPSTPTS